MRAVVCNEFGPPSALRVEERPDPEPGPGQVRIAVEAAGVNFVDALIVAGEYQIKPPLPFVAGTEVAGTIDRIGEGVTGLEEGQRVLASVGFGGFCTSVVVGQRAIAAIPNGMSAAAAAAFTQSYSTAMFALRDRARLRSGETLLVLGAAGGVGIAAIQVGRALGATVIAAASSQARLARCEEAGAHHLIDYSSQDLKERARALSDGGVDVVFDPVGADLTEPALRSLGDFGRLCVIGFARGGIPSLPTNQVLLRNRSVLGIDWGIWGMTHPTEQGILLADALALVANGKLSPPEPRAVPLADAATVLEDLLEHRLVGKAVLTP